MAIEKKLLTRIVLTHDDYANYSGKVLKAGEVVLAKVGTTQAVGQVSEPIWMMKVGDGTKTVENLPWLVAPAADVYGWAKKASLDANDLPAIPGDKLGITVTVTGNGNAITGAAWDAATKTLTLTKGETFVSKDEFDNREDKDTTYSAGTKLTLDGTTFNHEATTRTDGTNAGVEAEFGKAFTVVDSIESDATGHITSVKTKEVTLPTPEEVTLPTVSDSYEEGKLVTAVSQTDGEIAVTRKAVEVVHNNNEIYLTIDGTKVGEGFSTDEFIKDGMIKSVTLVDTDADNNEGKFLRIEWNVDTDADADTEVDITYVDVTTLVDVYTAGNGIDMSGDNVISHAKPTTVATNITKTDRTYVSGIEFDEFGHVTKIETGVETDQDLTHNHDDIYKKLQTAVVDPTADGNSLTFIDTITQDEQGKITATKKNVKLGDYALKSELPTDFGVTKITSTGSDSSASGLKVTPVEGTGEVNIEIDDTIVFVLDGGTASDLV